MIDMIAHSSVATICKFLSSCSHGVPFCPKLLFHSSNTNIQQGNSRIYDCTLAHITKGELHVCVHHPVDEQHVSIFFKACTFVE